MAKQFFDCFTFFNELDLLELLSCKLYDAVDYFVIAKAPVTFKDQAKPLFYRLSQARFAPFQDQIIHLVIENMPASSNAWDFEHFQRNALRHGFETAASEDIIIISDADEIVKTSTVAKLRETSGFTQIGLHMYQYYMNLREQMAGPKCSHLAARCLMRSAISIWQEPARKRYSQDLPATIRN